MKVRPRHVGGPRSAPLSRATNDLDDPVSKLTQYACTAPPVRLGGRDKYCVAVMITRCERFRAVYGNSMTLAHRPGWRL